MAMFIWMMLVLKIPIAALFYLVWWSTRAPEEEAHDEPREGGRDRDSSPRPSPPRSPRRGPHAEPLPRGKERTRVSGRRLRERT